MSKGVEAAIKWYEENRPLYESLARKVEDVIRENLEQSNVVYHSVTSRGKSLESFTAKAKQEKYSDPLSEIKDMAGVRVITYLESDVQKVAEIVERLFAIDIDSSLDQSKLLGSDKVGYRSVHYVATFDKKRCKLPEYTRYKDLPFEIQIRSLLQHAWAEIEHDRNYKFSGKLPTELGRRFHLVAGMLEVADREFVAIAHDIDKYKADVIEELKKDELNIDINTVSLKEYLSKNFAKLIENEILSPVFGPDDSLSREIVEELQLFGISKLSGLDRIIPADLEDRSLDLRARSNFAGIIRRVMIISNAKKYFEVCWQNRWKGLGEGGLELLQKYHADIATIQKYIKMRRIL
jgi:ppGpp synthetase/RelA/SpoT-type nucleotidyltranferase